MARVGTTPTHTTDLTMRIATCLWTLRACAALKAAPLWGAQLTKSNKQCHCYHEHTNNKGRSRNWARDFAHPERESYRRRKLLQLDITRSMSMKISSVRTGEKLILPHQAEIAQLVARWSHNPKVVSSILTFRMVWCWLVSSGLARAADHCRLGPGPSAFRVDTPRLSRHGHEFLGGLGCPVPAQQKSTNLTIPGVEPGFVAATSRRPNH